MLLDAWGKISAMGVSSTSQRIPTFCALCVSHCGAIATVEDGRFTALDPDPTHPTGKALCIKGKVAPELVYHPGRLLHPIERTRPKGDADPGWRRIGWDEALDKIASRLLALSREHGPESVLFGSASPSTSAISDSLPWIERLRRAFGSPNQCSSVELCAWGRYFASSFTFGVPVPGMYLPDLERAGCILLWGYNPSLARLAHATATVSALQRGARLIVVDPRKAGLAHKADVWLRVRPGTDAALALAIARVMIERGWFDRSFVLRWTNAPFLVRSDTGRLLREADLSESGDPNRFVAWDEARSRPVACDPRSASFDAVSESLALSGSFVIDTRGGPLACRPVFDQLAERCRARDAEAVERITGVSARDVEQAAHLLWHSRPTSYYAWSGVEQHANATQITRAIAQLYALTGSFESPGGNLRFASVPMSSIDGANLLSPEQRGKSLGLARRPLGISRFELVTSDDFYTAALEGRPYRVRGLVGFGTNMLMANADTARGREALRALDFQVHADLFMNPTAELADIVLPVASPFETEALATGFEISAEAQSLVQLRRPVVAPRGEARSDREIVFGLATRLGLGEHFFDGDLDAGLRHQLAPSSLTLDALRAEPSGLRVALETRDRQYAAETQHGLRGFFTPSGTIELYSETLHEHGYPALPDFEEPSMSPRARPDLADQFPLVLTCAKSTWFCETQHRALPSLRRRAPDPLVEIHADTARARGIAEGDWVRIHTPSGSVRARASFNPTLDPGVVCGQHGWWQACEAIGAPGYDPFGSDGANLNLLVRHEPSDEVGGGVPHRAYLCNVLPDD